jgi:hypothetical protein
MEQSVEKIIERNLLEVFNGRDADSRRQAIDELWDRDGVFIDPGGVHEGIEKINVIIGLLFTQFEGYVFSVRGPGQSMHGVGRLPWSYGPPDDPHRRDWRWPRQWREPDSAGSFSPVSEDSLRVRGQPSTRAGEIFRWPPAASNPVTDLAAARCGDESQDARARGSSASVEEQRGDPMAAAHEEPHPLFTRWRPW